MTDALVLRGVDKTYGTSDAAVHAVRKANLVVARGELVAIVGPSGSGKSSLLAIAAGLLEADAGEVELAGISLTDLGERERAWLRRTCVGLVFQFGNFVASASVLENVELACRIGGRRAPQARRRAGELLDLLGIRARASAAPAELSGGERQRLGIARALANAPTVVLADEPTGALDSAGREEILELLRRLHGSGQTIVLVTHDPVIAAVAGRVVSMCDGRLDDDAPGPSR
jgi:putative ABC transport system ATP-binding protein